LTWLKLAFGLQAQTFSRAGNLEGPIMDTTTLGMLAVIAAVVAGALIVSKMILRVSKDRFMRCPETGAITLVGVDCVASQDGGSKPVVCRCALWPEKAGCAQRCLERYEESSAGYPVNLSALRPFGPH
jgi:hypothetical protein